MDESEVVEVHLRNKHLEVACGKIIFGRFRNAVLTSLQRSEDISEEDVESIYVYSKGTPSGPRSVGIRDRVYLVGCSLVSLLLVFVFCAGVEAIVKRLFRG